MRKIGTITTAVSFIFLGAALLLSQFDPDMGYRMFKFWPLLIILLGIEILLSSASKNRDGKKAGFSLLTIFVLILFIFGDGVWTFMRGMDFSSIKENIKNSIEYDNQNKVSCNISKSADKSQIIIKAVSGDIEIQPASDNMVTFDGKIGIKDGSDVTDTDNLFKDDGEAVILDFTSDENIKSIEGVLYIPDKGKLKVAVTNGKIESEGKMLNVDAVIEATNAYVDVKEFKSADISSTNGMVEAEDIKNLKVKNINGKISICGDVENMDISNKNGVIESENDLCRNVTMNNSMGNIKLSTGKYNGNVTASTETGTIKLNGEDCGKSLSQSMGSGEGNINITTQAGEIKIDIKE